MGLVFSHGDAHWSYGDFHRFRRKLAKTINVYFNQMQGVYGGIPWDSIPEHPLHLILNHSDCEDSIPSSVCALLADAIAEAVKTWPEDEQYMPSRLIAGLREAAEVGEDFEFM